MGLKKYFRHGFYLMFFSGLLAVLLVSAAAAQDPEFSALIEKKGAPARELFEKPTLYREAELKNMPCSAGDFEFLLDRPRTSVALAGRMHKSLDRYQITMQRPGILHIDDQKNLVGDMELIASQPGRRMYYITGYWKLLPGVKLVGRMALVVDFKEEPGPACKGLDAKARGYMMVDNSVAGAAFKLAAYMFPEKVNARIDRFATAVRKVVEGVHNDPAGTLQRLERVPYVPQEEAGEFRARFLKQHKI